MKSPLLSLLFCDSCTWTKAADRFLVSPDYLKGDPTLELPAKTTTSKP